MAVWELLSSVSAFGDYRGRGATVKERPILFQGAMVNALLEERKTQTRRIVKPMRGHQSTWLTVEKLSRSPRAKIARTNPENWFGAQFAHPLAGQFAHGVWNEEWSPYCWVKCPYGEPGDRLWSRESLTRPDGDPWLYSADNYPVMVDAANETAMLTWAHHKEQDYCPSIHMPRWASRIRRELTDVGVQRLNEITDEDALAEGVAPHPSGGFHVPGIAHPNEAFPYLSRPTPREMFAALWDCVNGPGAWLKNEWVWVLSLRKVNA